MEEGGCSSLYTSTTTLNATLRSSSALAWAIVKERGAKKRRKKKAPVDGLPMIAARFLGPVTSRSRPRPHQPECCTWPACSHGPRSPSVARYADSAV